MGCNQSKNEDIGQDQGRAVIEPPRQRTIQPERRISEVNVNQNKYSDIREKEAEYFKQIIERTNQNLINLGQISNWEGIEVSEKSDEFGNEIMRTKIIFKENSLINDQIPQNFANIKTNNIFTEPIIDTTNASNLAKLLFENIQQFTLRDCGDFVISFS
eukprot:TRINITY_DN156_c2_g1_i1.p1 TRINITY_DN156_c2_g1~~TRINITY_DN156_c2_g1_i1.p1  ORF type:complete len:159 (+),score=65.02 TRINITY_DN156_c2_g1_i1:64-540(+)